MNQIKHKLQSKRGASLLIAMVYLVFAVFIGGSVLAAASANGYRIEHLSDQQDYLDQRSAAMLLAEEMETMPTSAWMPALPQSLGRTSSSRQITRLSNAANPRIPTP